MNFYKSKHKRFGLYEKDLKHFLVINMKLRITTISIVIKILDNNLSLRKKDLKSRTIHSLIIQASKNIYYNFFSFIINKACHI